MRLIDADELKKAIPNVEMDCFQNCRSCELLDRYDVVQIIDEIPTADAEPVKHGHWIVHDEGEGYPNTCECSNCGTFYDEEDAYCYDYCPSCGAKMDEVTDGNDAGL